MYHGFVQVGEQKVNKILDIYNYSIFKQLQSKQHPPYQLPIVLITPFPSFQNMSKQSLTWLHQLNYHFIALNIKKPGPVWADRNFSM